VTWTLCLLKRPAIGGIVSNAVFSLSVDKPVQGGADGR
jgi:hypothetical protein